MTVLVAPSILSADIGNLRGDIISIDAAGADWIHIDVMDGSFVPPITFGANVVSLAKASTRKPLDVHLMIEKPERHIESFSNAGADYLTIHIEACEAISDAVAQIKSFGMKAGVTLRPETPVERILPVLEAVDLVLVMTVQPGWGGQKFIPEMLQRIERVVAEAHARGVSPLIEVDGGINDLTAKQCVQAGANVLVAGNYIFSSKDRAVAIQSLKKT